MSANREKGEVALVVNGREYTLVHNHHAIALFQAHFTNQDAAAASSAVRLSVLSVPARIAKELANETDPEKLRVRLEMELLRAANSREEEVASIFLLDKYVREGSLLHQEALLWALLQKHHAREMPQVTDASDLIDADAEACGKALRRALGYAAPDTEDVQELQEAARANPPEAQPKRKRRVNGSGASASSVRVASV